MGKDLYPWQEACLERWFSNQARGMVQAVTGSGKTLLALTAAARLEQRLAPKKLLVKIVVPTGALMRQWNRALQEFLAHSSRLDASKTNLRHLIGLRGSGFFTPDDRQYMIYVINSARYELARQIMADLKGGASVLLIADECHRYVSGQNRLIFEFLPYIQEYEGSFYSLGLSATLPAGQAQKELAAFLGRKIYAYDIHQAVRMQNVCQYDIYHISLSFQKAEEAEYQELSERMTALYRTLLRTHPYLRDLTQRERFECLRTLASDKNPETSQAAASYMALSYKRKKLVCSAQNRLACACDLVERLPLGEKILIFGEHIRQADELYQLLSVRFPGRAGRCHSGMSSQANKNAIDDFRNGMTRILISCKALDEGLNIPDASVGIILSGTSVQRQRIQRLGRIIRRHEGKDRASLYYLHIAESSEDKSFLPENDHFHVTELEYHANRHAFSNPRYDSAADMLLDGLLKTGASPEKLREARRCLLLGQIRSDWLLTSGELEKKRAQAKATEDRNYWICMKKIRRLL